MKTAAIAIDTWKKHIFARMLAENGYTFTESKGLTSNMLILSVKTENMHRLSQVVLKCEEECNRQKGKK